jgi:hypothetical protein
MLAGMEDAARGEDDAYAESNEPKIYELDMKYV